MKVIVKKYSAFLTLSMMMFNILIPFQVSAASSDELIFPLKEISKLECRFEEFSTLSSNCKQDLPILDPDDYSKYATKDDGYNDYTRIYTMLWGSSYKYGWDVGSGGHQGTDFATAKGTPVYTIADGKVIEAGNDIGWGNYVSVEHSLDGKTFISNYAHLSKINVDKGDRIDIGDKIGEVGSTGNSTGNHLHFQIDLPNTFHPYYYDWNACPYSYYEITEGGVCFDELDAHTYDPLVFLASNGAVLDESKTSSSSSNSNSSSSNTTSNSNDPYEIFNTTVYYGYGSSYDVEQVQKIYAALDYYDGKITGDFEDVEESIIEYQIDTGVISNRNDDGAGWFGPMTRAQTEKDYRSYGTTGGEILITSNDNDDDDDEKEIKEVNTVSRENLMTREEIEAQEMEEFLKTYDIDFINSIYQLNENEVQTTILRIENEKEKGFKGNTPGNVTFSYDSDIISVFPQSFYNFTDGEREINITGKKTGHTNITIKIGEVIVKTLSISVGQEGEKPEATSAKIYMQNESILGEKNTGIILMKDQYSNALVKSEYEGEFSLSSNQEIQYCIKRGRLQDIKAIYNRSCFIDEYTDSLTYTYDDTIEGVLIFDYKVLSNEDAKVSLNTKGSSIASMNIGGNNPKGLSQSYEYYDEVVQTLAAGITDGINQGYFLEDRLLSQADAIGWITNAAKQTNNNLDGISSEENSSVKDISREEFLQLTYKYLGNNSTTTVSRDYRDMQGEEAVLVASLLGDDYSWKDDFGQDYFQPDKEITRGEAAYMLVEALGAQGQGALVRK